MRLPDVNILVAAHRREAENHEAVRRWLEDAMDAPEPLAISDAVLSGFLRIVTQHRVVRTPSTMAEGLEFADQIRSAPSAVPVAPGPRHWRIFSDLCRAANARGNLIPDAWLAALAIESGSECVSLDRDFARFPGLRWSHPLQR